MAKRFKVVGINDEQTYCDICGKQELTKVVWFEDQETGDTFAAGVVCAAKIQGKTVAAIKKEVEDFKAMQFKAARRETAELRKAYNSMLDNAPRGDFKDRLAYINSSSEKVLFYAACEVAASKYQIEARRLHY